MSASPNSYPYQLGGSLDFKHPTYVVRQADKELYDSLKNKEFCYVLNSRQTGKSSLRVQMMYRLQAEGIACAAIDLTGIGSQRVTAEQWYGGIIQELISSFELRINRRTWWRERNDISPVQRFKEFLEKVLLKEIRQDIVVFIDEIDSVLRLDFKDNFFAVIKACYNKRADNPDYRRLSFALLGVATPSDLIRDPNRTPFNIGHAIELNGFQLHEAQPLTKGLELKTSNPEAVLREILTWTGGQPFLSQKLCKLIVTSQSPIPENCETAWVEQIVQSRLIENWESQDEPEHLKTIRDRLLMSGQHTIRLLAIYQQILAQGEVAADNSPAQTQLRLSGLVVKQLGSLKVYNRIYASVFDQRWVDKALSDLRPSVPQAQLTCQHLVARVPPNPLSFSRWYRLQVVLLLSVIVTAVVMGVRQLGMLQGLELLAFDHLMRLRPLEEQDKRLLIIEVTEDDFKLPEQQQRIGSLSDKALALVLKKLRQFKPRAIGLDIYRDRSVNSQQADLATNMRSDDSLFAICKVSDREFNHPGILPPPEIPTERQGFSDVVVDPDGILRRHLIALAPPPASPCTTPYALSAKLAFHYLEAEGIFPEYTQNWNLQLGKVVFKRLQQHMGGYQKVNTWGYQILLNYRSPLEVAPTVTLTDILTGSIEPDDVTDRIVLIGVTAQSVHDFIPTPYSGSQDFYKEMPGVVVQAQMVSQILSAVLDGRPLLWVWTYWSEVLWIWGWSFIGGVVAWGFGYPVLLRLGLIGGTLGTLYGLCCVIFTQGGWIPLVPSAFALVASGIVIVAYTTYQTQP